MSEFPYILRFDRGGRKGQKCRLVTRTSAQSCIEFEDGHRMVTTNTAVVRSKAPSGGAATSQGVTRRKEQK